MAPRVALLVLATFLVPAATRAQHNRPHATMPAFRSQQELAAWLRAAFPKPKPRWTGAPHCAGTSFVQPDIAAPETTRVGAVITGRVRASTGETIAGAQVFIVELNARSNANDAGRFALALPPTQLAGWRTVPVRVRAIGYRPASATVAIGPHDSIVVDFSLCQDELRLDAIIVSGTGNAAVSITNTQHEGVDEGGIVKLHGEHLVILRRGRLFTVALGQRDLTPVAAVNAFGPGIDPRDAWYDELIVYRDRVVVVGYSYARGGTELGVFRIDSAGRLAHEGTYQLKSDDYYSARNYASRLVGSRLTFYTPLYLPRALDDHPLAWFPALRRWRPGTDTAAFRPIVQARNIYRPAAFDPTPDLALHTITSCDLDAAELSCTASVLIGPPGRISYVSPEAVYVWMDAGDDRKSEGPARALLSRLPLDGSAPSAVRVSGGPIDQFSFLESGGAVQVLVLGEARDEGMWRTERARSGLSLLRLPLRSFGDGHREAEAWRYHRLPAPSGPVVHNRFVGDHLLYGAGNGWGPQHERGSTLYAVNWRHGEITAVELPHGADRIEVMGFGAVVVGADGRDLHFSGIHFEDGAPPFVAQRYILPLAAQGETRSHGFFYRADGPDDGVLGLPVRGSGSAGWQQLFRESASVIYLRNARRRFRPLGTLEARAATTADDQCEASCVDWYGNSRPLFIAGRVFALLGYELVEGSIRSGRVEEARRVSFAPAGTGR